MNHRHNVVPKKDAEKIRITTGWWYTYPSEKYESQLGLLFPIYGKIKNVPNHQPNHIGKLGVNW